MSNGMYGARRPSFFLPIDFEAAGPTVAVGRPLPENEPGKGRGKAIGPCSRLTKTAMISCALQAVDLNSITERNQCRHAAVRAAALGMLTAGARSAGTDDKAGAPMEVSRRVSSKPLAAD